MKIPRSRSHFVALEMLYLHKYKSSLKTFNEKRKRMECPQLFPGVHFTSKRQKDTLISFAAQGRLIALLFHSFEVPAAIDPKYLTSSQTKKHRTYSTRLR